MFQQFSTMCMLATLASTASTMSSFPMHTFRDSEISYIHTKMASTDPFKNKHGDSSINYYLADKQLIMDDKKKSMSNHEILK